MRILNVIRSVNPAAGGPVEVIRQFSPVLAELGCSVETVSADPPDAPWVKECPFALCALGGDAGTYGRSKPLVDWLHRERTRFDAVISHGLWQFNGLAVRRALAGTDTPYFVFPHGMLDPWFRRAYPLKHVKKHAYWLAVEHRVLRDARRVLYTCEEERLLAQNTFFPYRAAEAVAPLGTSGPDMDLQVCRETFLMAYPQLRGARVLLFLGRLHPKKGCDLLLRAAAGINHPFHIVLAGPCEDQQYLTDLKRLAANRPVTFTGMLAGALRWGAFATAEAFVLPSHQENFGMAVVEALACGVPVLISRRVNIWREIEQDHGGFVETDDLAGTGRLLEKWIGQGGPEFRAQALASFRSRFEIRRSARRLIEVLSQAIQ